MKEQQGYYAPTRTRTRPPVADDATDYDYGEPRTNTSTRRYVGQATPRNVIRVTNHEGLPIQRASRTQTRTAQKQLVALPKPTKQTCTSHHWLFYAGIVLFLMLFGWIVLSVVGNWWNGLQDDWHYGKPRTFQIESNVGHGGISHFTVENLQGHILITEVQINNPAKAKIFLGPTLSGAGADLAPATLTFEDVNGDNLIDMILTVDNTKHIFLNSKDGFHAQSPQGHITGKDGTI